MSDEPLMLSPADTARVLGLGKNAVYAAIHEGRLPVVRVGRRLLVPRASLPSFIAAEIDRSRNENGGA